VKISSKLLIFTDIMLMMVLGNRVTYNSSIIIEIDLMVDLGFVMITTVQKL